MENYGIILASGLGVRYKSDTPKQFLKIAGKTILEHTTDIFEKNQYIDHIILVITPEYRQFVEEILLKNNYKKIIAVLNGGETRKESSYIGISAIDDHEANVIIHDCARPFLSDRIIEDCVKALDKYSAVDVAIPSADTIIKVKDDIIQDIPNRSEFMRGQTPQCFKLSVIKKAHELSKNDSNFTDDCGLIVRYKICDVFVVKGEMENIKITYSSDIFMADKLFQIKNMIPPTEKHLSDLKGKVLVIFGGSSGIGKAIENMAQCYGAKVYIASRRTGIDIVNYNDVINFLAEVNKKTDKIDYVINTAGVLNIGKLLDRNIEDIKKDVDINYIGSINVAKASIPYLQKTKGCILMFTSSSYTRGRALYSTYSSSKAGIVNLVQALAEELTCDDIRINTINPERTATPMRLKAFGKEQKNTLLDADKVAEASLKTLLSNLTGQVIDVRRNFDE